MSTNTAKDGIGRDEIVRLEHQLLFADYGELLADRSAAVRCGGFLTSASELGVNNLEVKGHCSACTISGIGNMSVRVLMRL